MADCKESTEGTNGPRPPKIVKFDAPEESSDNSTNKDTEGQSNEENSKAPSSPYSKNAKIHCPVLAASKFGNSFGVSEFTNTTKRKSALLRPSALSSLTTSPGPSSKTPSLLAPKFSNPLSKLADETALADNGAVAEDAEFKEKVETDKTEETKIEEKASNNEAPKFLPLVASPKDIESDNVNNGVAINSSTPSFVFGQNLKERVTVASDAESSDTPEKDEYKEESATSNENGSSELLFSNAATVCRSTARSGLTLNEAAQEMEEANKANKRKYSQVTTLTGEEEETNVLQINCKLFAFDKTTSGWQERGRGTLRLNDRYDEESRLVGRVSGTQRLVLNTKVWPRMTAERAGPKSLRLTAMDVQGDIRIFIVQAAPKEVGQLHSLLLQRVKRAQERQPKKLASDH